MNEIVSLLESLRPILERWYLVLFAIVLVTLLGIPARVLVSSLAALLRVPAVFSRTEIDPPLRRATPTAPYRLLRNLRDYFRPVLDRPARALSGAAGALFFTARDAANWPVAAITSAIVGLVGALVLGLVFFDLIGMTHLGPWDDLAPTPRRWLTRTALALAVCFLLLSLFLALWRASIIVTDFIPAELANKFEGIALTFPIPLMLVATALIAWGAIAMPWLAWILVVGALAIVMLLLALVLRAVSRALPPLAVLLGGILRVLGIAGFLLLIGVVALAATFYFVVSVVAVGVVFVIAFAALLAWAAVWLIAEAIVYTFRLLARIADALELVLQRLIDALMYPGRVLWNWIASFDRARAIHLQPIRPVEVRALRLAPGEQPQALEEAAR